jgi:hypothetical protein
MYCSWLTRKGQRTAVGGILFSHQVVNLVPSLRYPASGIKGGIEIAYLKAGRGIAVLKAGIGAQSGIRHHLLYHHGHYSKPSQCLAAGGALVVSR